MLGFDSRLTTVFSIIFVTLGIFNLVVGRNRMLEMRASGQTLPWYQQMAILTGIEYILLGIVLLLNLSINGGFFPGALAGLASPLYTVFLILAAIVLAAMLLQVLRGRRQRTQTIPATTDPQAKEQEK